ncbi:MAG: hypothetical protein IJ213_09935 [Bacteroidales bacterium]|nr:hypothetical protein [Bacteroidales bacterium]
MILFVFEGEKREPLIFDSLNKLFFPRENNCIVCSFGNNIYELYRQMKETNEDLVPMLKDLYKNKDDSPFSQNSKTSDYSQVFLFFDYDFHNKFLSLEQMNIQIKELLNYFDNETDNGKLYINYPMVESIRYTKQLPDDNYWRYTLERKNCNQFKKLTHNFSDYKSLDFLVLKEKDNETIINNWKYLKEQNISKANYICNGINEIPENKQSIEQLRIFNNQIEKYVNTPLCVVSILNSFPLFLYEYFK